jgi:hypothetical protein
MTKIGRRLQKSVALFAANSRNKRLQETRRLPIMSL